MTNETEKGSFSPKNEEKFQKNYVTKVLKFRSTLIINTCHKDKAKQFFLILRSKTYVNATTYPALVLGVFPFVCQTIMGELHNNDYQ